MTFEQFKEEIDSLEFWDKLSIYNSYVREHSSPEDEIFEFTDDFFNEMFSTPYDAARALHFGKVNSWQDEYIKFDAYANLQSLTEYEANEIINDRLPDIYDEENCWSDYIDPSEFDNDEENEED